MLLYFPHISYSSYDSVCKRTSYLKYASLPILNVSVAANSNMFKSKHNAIKHGLLFGNEEVALKFFDISMKSKPLKYKKILLKLSYCQTSITVFNLNGSKDLINNSK